MIINKIKINFLVLLFVFYSKILSMNNVQFNDFNFFKNNIKEIDRYLNTEEAKKLYTELLTIKFKGIDNNSKFNFKEKKILKEYCALYFNYKFNYISDFSNFQCKDFQCNNDVIMKNIIIFNLIKLLKYYKENKQFSNISNEEKETIYNIISFCPRGTNQIKLPNFFYEREIKESLMNYIRENCCSQLYNDAYCFDKKLFIVDYEFLDRENKSYCSARYNKEEKEKIEINEYYENKINDCKISLKNDLLRYKLSKLKYNKLKFRDEIIKEICWEFRNPFLENFSSFMVLSLYSKELESKLKFENSFIRLNKLKILQENNRTQENFKIFQQKRNQILTENEYQDGLKEVEELSIKNKLNYYFTINPLLKFKNNFMKKNN